MSFKDHFSTQALSYAKARPTYPAALFEWLAAQCPLRERAWDAGCGNGQATLSWAAWFDHVYATDPSAAQIANALPHPGVRYAVERAEDCSLHACSVDLVGVAQALHWFDFEAFFAQVRRVLGCNGLFAAFSYGSMQVAPDVDHVVHAFEHQTVGPFWPPERAHVDAQYRTIAIPLQRIQAPAFEMTQEWDLAQTLAYLGTWSAVQRFDQHHGGSAMAAFEPALADAWGEPEMRRRVRWPLLVWAGRP